jgi:tetratricopeptide (TPR) repeat protein
VIALAMLSGEVMMGWNYRLYGGLVLSVAVVLVGGVAWPARANDSRALDARLTELNRTTGTDPLRGYLRQLTQHKEKTKALVSHAWNKLKDKKERFSYHSAYLLALAAQDVGNDEASAAFYRACAAQAVKLESTSKIIQSYGGLIDLLYENKQYDKAARVCREILEMKPPVQKPRLILLATKNRFGEADFEELDNYNAAAIVRQPVHKILIQAVAKQGDFDKALKLVDNLIKAQDGWEERELKGFVLREAGQYAEAAKAYEGVLDKIRTDKELDRKRKGDLEDQSRYILSTIYVDAKQVDKAADQLQILVKKHPDEPGYQNDLGYIWADHDLKLEEAEKLIRRALDLDRERRKKHPKVDRGENGAYLDSLGWVLFKQKKLKEAKEFLQKALEDKDSQHIEIFDHLGDVLMALGERDGAISAWQQGLKVAGSSPREMRRRERVERKIKEAKTTASR